MSRNVLVKHPSRKKYKNMSYIFYVLEKFEYTWHELFDTSCDTKIASSGIVPLQHLQPAKECLRFTVCYININCCNRLSNHNFFIVSVLTFVTETGRFEVRMKIFDDGSYSAESEYTHAPTIAIGTDVYVQV